jgi:hypothetical protein
MKNALAVEHVLTFAQWKQFNLKINFQKKKEIQALCILIGLFFNLKIRKILWIL